MLLTNSNAAPGGISVKIITFVELFMYECSNQLLTGMFDIFPNFLVFMNIILEMQQKFVCIT